jgi:3-hydroxymyristoyl/3-hydroxydecanoyl-(acyl carrier protein) dehydratase
MTMLDPKIAFEIHLKEGEGKAQWVACAELDYFQGHFPGNPILPAVAIVDVSIEILRRALGKQSLYVKTIKSSKFMEPVLPGTLIEIAFHESSPNEWFFEWKSFARLSLAL